MTTIYTLPLSFVFLKTMEESYHTGISICASSVSVYERPVLVHVSILLWLLQAVKFDLHRE